MKKILLHALLLLTGAHQAYGMKRVRFASVKSQIYHQLDKGQVKDAYTTYTMYKGIFPNFSFSNKEQESLRAPLHKTIEKTNAELVKDYLNPLRTNSWWLLPASTTLLATAQTPFLISLGIVGTSLGSFGLKKQCDLLANSIDYKQLCDKADTLEKIFESKESELKTK